GAAGPTVATARLALGAADAAIPPRRGGAALSTPASALSPPAGARLGRPGSGWPGSGRPGSGWPGSGWPGSGWRCAAGVRPAGAALRGHPAPGGLSGRSGRAADRGNGSGRGAAGQHGPGRRVLLLLHDRVLLNLDLEVEQQPDGLFLDPVHHGAEHVGALALILDQRVALAV